MIRLFISLLIALLLGALLAYGVHQDPGYIRISIGHWLIESNVWMGLFLLLLGGGLLYLLLGLVFRLRAGRGELASGLAQAQRQQAAGDHVQSLATLLRLRQLAPKHPFVLKLLRDQYVQAGDWQALRLLLPDLRKFKACSEADLHQLEHDTWAHLLRQSSSQAATQAPAPSLKTLDAVWRQVPTALRQDPDIITRYANRLSALGADDQAETLIRKQLRRAWHDPLIHLYGRLRSANPEAQLHTAENWLPQQADNPQLLLALGRLCLRNELWGKARRYLEDSLQLQQNRETLAEWIRLKIALGEQATDTLALLQPLLDDIQLPDLPLPKHR